MLTNNIIRQLEKELVESIASTIPGSFPTVQYENDHDQSATYIAFNLPYDINLESVSR